MKSAPTVEISIALIDQRSKRVTAWLKQQSHRTITRLVEMAAVVIAPEEEGNADRPAR